MDLHIDPQKLSGYCLNPQHPLGKHKARVFAAVLGLGPDDGPILKEMILSGARQASWRQGKQDVYGQRWVCDIQCSHKQKNAVVRCSWIVSAENFEANLTSCYVKTS